MLVTADGNGQMYDLPWIGKLNAGEISGHVSRFTGRNRIERIVQNLWGFQQSQGHGCAAGLRACLCLPAKAVLTACFPKAETPIPPQLVQKMKAKGMKSTSPILLRIYKDENVLEVWKQKDTGRLCSASDLRDLQMVGKAGAEIQGG